MFNKIQKSVKRLLPYPERSYVVNLFLCDSETALVLWLAWIFGIGIIPIYLAEVGYQRCVNRRDKF